jgi:ABC-type taurine transport system substrate-binding protein
VEATQQVDIIAGFRGVLYKKAFFKGNVLKEELLKAPEGAWWVDDDFISGVASKVGVPRLVVPRSLEADFFNIEGASTSDNALSSGANKDKNIERQFQTLSYFVANGMMRYRV